MAAPAVVPEPWATPDTLPPLTLTPGEGYFRRDGRPTFIYSRNLARYQPPHFKTLLDWTESSGSRLVRLQLDGFGMGYTGTGAVDPNWAVQWDQVFDEARAHGIHVLPVFSVWFEWNAGSEPPDLPADAVIIGQAVTLTVPGSATAWQVDFYEPKAADPNGASAQVFSQDAVLVIPLSNFAHGIAFNAHAKQ